MIIIVTGLKRSGTSLMMKILKEGGVQVRYDEEFQDHMLENTANTNKYFYEVERFLYTGFTSDDKPLLEYKAVKVFYSGINNIPLMGNYKIINMKRDPEKVIESLRLYKTPTEHANDILWVNQWKDTVPNKPFLDVSYEGLMRDPVSTITRVFDYLGLPPSKPVEELAEEVDPEMWHVR